MSSIVREMSGNFRVPGEWSPCYHQYHLRLIQSVSAFWLVPRWCGFFYISALLLAIFGFSQHSDQ